jgi:signal transduction histidine kinase
MSPAGGARRLNGGDEPTGLGLGFFIAKTLLERSGATVDFENRLSGPRRGHPRALGPRDFERRPWSLRRAGARASVAP